MDIYFRYFLIYGAAVAIIGLVFLTYEWFKNRRAKILSAPHLRSLDDPSSSIRIKAIIALGEIGYELSAPSLVKCLEDTDASVREVAALALGKIGSKNSLASLAHSAVHDKESAVRTAAVKALQFIGEKYLRYINEAQLLKSSTAVQRANILNELLDTYIIPGVMLTMKDDDPNLQKISEAVYQKLTKPRTEKSIKGQEPLVDSVQFSAFYPSPMKTQLWEDLFVYAHLEGENIQVENDLKAAVNWVEEKVFNSRKAKQTTKMRQGTRITVIPEVDAVQFEPVSITKPWTGNPLRFKFRFKSSDANASLRISIRVEGIEIAHIQFVLEGQENPLVKAKHNSQNTGIYQKIFVSYSRKDKEVVEAYRFAQLALGNDIFMDTYSIRSGEDWRAALAKAIDTADVFQLFWSKDSATSANVHDEWDYALTYKCPQTQCADFIRPVYWVNPIPAPPPAALSHLNFKYIPLKERFKLED